MLEFARAAGPLLAPRCERDETRPSRTDRRPADPRTSATSPTTCARVGEQVEGFGALLAGALQANLTQVSVRQNEDMRKISAWVAIIAVPTAVAGIYGMNFEYMPELGWRFGYAAVLLLIAAICVTLYAKFRRSGWL